MHCRIPSMLVYKTNEYLYSKSMLFQHIYLNRKCSVASMILKEVIVYAELATKCSPVEKEPTQP